VSEAEPSALVTTIPKLLKVMDVAPAGKTVRVTSVDPSALDLDSISVAGATTLTVQEEFAPKAKATLVLRATASARARCNPFVTDSAALRIWVFRIHVWKLGMAAPSKIAKIVMPIINSISENPKGLGFGKAFNTSPPFL